MAAAPGTPGNWAVPVINGYKLDTDIEGIQRDYTFKELEVFFQNTGIKQRGPGIFEPQITIKGFREHGIGLISAHELLKKAGVGSANDVEMDVLLPLGMNATPTVGDICEIGIATELTYKAPGPHDQWLRNEIQFKSRGKRTPPFPLLFYRSDNAAQTATNYSTTPYDDSADASAGTTVGFLAACGITLPTGVQSTGNYTISGNVADADIATVTIASNPAIIYRFKTTPAAINDVRIGASGLASMQNLFNAIIGSVSTSGASLSYFPGTSAVDLTQVNVAINSTTGQITFTAIATGTGPNAWTLTKTSTALTATTFAGGVAGDTYNVTVSSSTSSGGSYTQLAAFNGVGATRQVLTNEIALGTVINEFIKWTVTLASGAGTQALGLMLAGGRWWTL